MGHLHDSKGTYAKLHARIDKTQSGLADTPEVKEILTHLFTRQEAEIAIKMPIVPRRMASIARRTGMSTSELKPMLDRMADKGLVFDFHHPTKGDYYMLAPPVVGFFEMTMMSVRTDIDQKEVARMLSAYMIDRPEFMAEVMSGRTPLGRALVRENALAPDIASDILDYESATAIIEQAKQLSIALCYCRHKKSHLGKACDAPQDVCFQIDRAAEFGIRHGHSRPSDKKEVLEKLGIAREKGLVQVADNVRNEPVYICNCCGCCCGQLQAINRHGITHAVATSNYIASIDNDTCNGCGKCGRACPVQAISLRPRSPYMRSKTKKKMVAEVDESICLGCGVCHPSCKTQSLLMKSRQRRVLTPENTLERVLSMALGRGHVHDFLFDEHDGPTPAFLNRLTGAIENLPITRRLILNETLKSRFVGFLCAKAQNDKR